MANQQPHDGSPPPSRAPHRAARRTSGVIQLLGMGVFIYEAVIRTWNGGDIRTQVLAICALAIMGSEAAKDLLITLFTKTLGQQDEE